MDLVVEAPQLHGHSRELAEDAPHEVRQDLVVGHADIAAPGPKDQRRAARLLVHRSHEERHRGAGQQLRGGQLLVPHIGRCGAEDRDRHSLVMREDGEALILVTPGQLGAVREEHISILRRVFSHGARAGTKGVEAILPPHQRLVEAGDSPAEVLLRASLAREVFPTRLLAVRRADAADHPPRILAREEVHGLGHGADADRDLWIGPVVLDLLLLQRSDALGPRHLGRLGRADETPARQELPVGVHHLGEDFPQDVMILASVRLHDSVLAGISVPEAHGKEVFFFTCFLLVASLLRCLRGVPRWRLRSRFMRSRSMRSHSIVFGFRPHPLPAVGVLDVVVKVSLVLPAEGNAPAFWDVFRRRRDFEGGVMGRLGGQGDGDAFRTAPGGSARGAVLKVPPPLHRMPRNLPLGSR
mmetsp:Transcript_16092/g.48469  ORF Transcript_16092/g.48469 Transcript_16092/m.48469 type:complete len:413 (-) Transcript_16092:95-1333(-)